jgi:hypothetical protein
MLGGIATIFGAIAAAPSLTSFLTARQRSRYFQLVELGILTFRTVYFSFRTVPRWANHKITRLRYVSNVAADQSATAAAAVKNAFMAVENVIVSGIVFLP